MIALYGYSREEMLKMNVADLVLPEDREKSQVFFKTLKKNGSYDKYDGRFYDKKGDLKYIEVSSKAFYNDAGEMIGSRDIIRDVTEKKKIEAQLIDSEQKFRTVVTNSEAIIFILDKNGVFTLSEGKGLKALGLKPGEVVGESVFELYGDYPDIIHAVKLALEGTASKVIAKVGDLYYDTFYSPYFCPEGCQGVIGLSMDITERIQKEEELVKARKQAEESDQLKTAFLANLSHEIRTPMNAILGFSALMGNDGLSTEDRAMYLEIVQSKGNELLQLLTDMINVSKIEAGIISLNKEYVNVNQILSEFVTVAEHQVAERNRSGISIRHSMPEEEVIIYNDENKLRQVLNNLLQNAIKFTEEGFIELGYSKENGEIRFYMKDSGIGIDAREKELVFERFRQVNDALNRSAGGTGLGLYICKTLVTHMGGKIWVESAPNYGSTFYFSLPA
jgi:PAS domain S-box-containing protein